MKNKLIIYSLLCLIFVFALFIRIYKLETVPPGLNWDEASNGYRAYSILKTGKNEWGVKFPLFSKHVGDYRAEVYSYLAILPIKIYGLTIFAVRLPSAVMGGVAVLFFYLLVNSFLELAEFNDRSRQIVSLTACIFLSINPWSIHLSRQASEANIALSFTIISLAFLFRFLIRRKYSLFFLSILFASFSLYTYHSPRLVLPLIFIYLFFIKKSDFLRHKKRFLLGTFLGFILLLPMIFALQKGVLTYRPKTVSLFNDGGRKKILIDLGRKNKTLFYFEEVLRQAIRQFSLRWLFLGENYNLRFGTERYGCLLYPDLLLMIFGFAFFFNQKKQWVKFLYFWIIIAVLPTAFSSESPHSLRGYWLLPIFIIYSALGFYYLVKTGDFLKKVMVCLSFLFFYFFNFYFYYNYYLEHFPKTAEYDWQVFYKPVFSYIGKIQNQYEKILFTDHYLDPHIFLFFYQKIDPLLVQEVFLEKASSSISEVNVAAFENYQFGRIDWKDVVNYKRCLIIDKADTSSFRQMQNLLQDKVKIKKIKTIFLSNGSPIFDIFEAERLN